MRSRAGRGAVGESGAKRNLTFCFAACRAEEELWLARALTLASEVSSTIAPLEGDMLYRMFN